MNKVYSLVFGKEKITEDKSESDLCPSVSLDADTIIVNNYIPKTSDTCMLVLSVNNQPKYIVHENKNIEDVIQVVINEITQEAQLINPVETNSTYTVKKGNAVYVYTRYTQIPYDQLLGVITYKSVKIFSR